MIAPFRGRGASVEPYFNSNHGSHENGAGQKNTKNATVMAYVKSIYAFLHKVENDTSCFVAGSFVIADPRKKLSGLLKSASTAFVPPITHNGFCKSCLQHEIHFEDGINVQCPRKPQYAEIKKSIKWYTFTQGGYDYVFLKLERDGTFARAHLVRAGERYITNRHAFKPDVFSRREDPPKPWVNPHYRTNDPKGLMYDGVSVCCGPELWEGKGDEYFLCAELSEFFLDLAQRGQTLTDAQVVPTFACVPSY